jgi:soluble lytic murein transglycosylase
MTRIYLAKNIRARWCKRVAAGLVAFSLLPAAAPSGLAPLVRAYRASPNAARRAAIESYAKTHPAEEPLARLALGVTAYEQKDYAAAISALEALPAKLPLIADYPAYYLGAARVESNAFEGVPKDLAPVHAGTGSPLAGKAWIAEARALESSAASQGVQTLRDHYKELPQPDGDLTLAESYQAANDLPNATDFYQRVYAQYPLGAAADKASAALASIEAGMGAGFPQPLPEQLLHRADRLFELHAYAQARAEYQAAIDKLAGFQRDEARVRVGASDLANNNAAAAYSYLSALTLEESEADAERLYYLEECARHLNNDDGAVAAVRRLGEKYAKSGWRARALVALANRYLLANRAEDYLPLYKALYSDFPADSNAAASHWKVAFHAYLRDSGDAEGLLRAHLEAYASNGTTGAALYFLGRLYERKGEPAAARACYQKIVERLPGGYYAMLARGRLNAPEMGAAATTNLQSANTFAFLGALHFPPIAAIPTQATAATTLRIDRSRLLRSAGLADLADAELRFGARTDAQPALAAMEIASAADAPYLGMKAMKALAPDYLGRSLNDAPRQFWEYLFPLPYRAELTADARAQNLDPYLVAGLIRQESEFNPGAVSPANANGLMQVRLGTGRDFSRAVGIPRLTANMLLQPAPNLKIGTAVFRSMLDQNGGSPERTLAAYNAGPRHAAEWFSWNNYREPAEFVESIPFTETRDYVQAVIRNGEMYRRLYGQ